MSVSDREGGMGIRQLGTKQHALVCQAMRNKKAEAQANNLPL